MSRKNEKEKILRLLRNTDTALLLLLGFGLGALLIGIFFLFLGTFIEAESNEIWSFEAVLSGLMSIGISILVGVVSLLYWKFIFLKTGSLFSQIHGFSLLMAFMSAVSGAAFSAFLAYYIIL